MKNYLATWFYAETPDDESYYPQVGGNTSSSSFQMIYWKCVYCFFESVRLTHNKNMPNLLFFTNVNNIPEDICGINLNKYFDDNNINVIKFELSNKVPKDWYSAWRNQFYLFDILDYCGKSDGNYLILDSDCLIRKSLIPIFELIKKNNIINYNYGYADDHVINGISTLQMRELYTEFFAEEGQQLSYYCGEFIGVNNNVIPDILKTYHLLWKLNYRKYLSKQPKLNEEAHFLSLIYYKLGYTEALANNFIKRIWTSVRYDNACASDYNLTIWHLPDEKKYGFDRIFKWLSSENRTKQDFIGYINNYFHLSSPTLYRKTRKAILKVKEKIMSKLHFALCIM